MEKKPYMLHLPYFKQGDDLGSCQAPNKTDSEAFYDHTQTLLEAAKILAKCAIHAKEGNLEIDQADTHVIMINCTEEVAKDLGDCCELDPFGGEEEELTLS